MSYDYFKTPDPEEPKEVTWGDYTRAAGSTVAGIGAGSAGLMRQMFEAGQQPEAAQIFRGLQTASRNLGEDIEGGMTEEGRARNAAGVTTEKFWEHPVSSIALKAVGMSPYLLAAAVPGALIGEGIAGMAATGAAAGWLAAGDVADEITKKPDKMSDQELQAQSKLYADWRNEGVEEREARQNLNQIMVGAKPALAFILGAGTGVFGPAGNIVRGLGRKAVGEAAPAFMGRHGVKAAALEGGASELAEETYGAVAAQKSEIEGGLRKDYDQSEILDRGLTGMVLGAGFGAASGIGGGKGKAKADEIRAAKEQRDREEATGIQAPADQAGVAAETEAVPAKGRKAAKDKGVTVGVDPAVKAALDAEQVPTPKVDVADAAVPPTPQPPAPPAPTPAAAAPVPPAAEQAPVAAPPAGAPQEAAPVAAPPQAGVTSGVTPPALDEATLTEMARRGFAPEEVAQLTPEQLQTILKQPVPAATDISARARAAPTAPTTDGTETESSLAAVQPEQPVTPPVARPTSEPPIPSPTGEVPTPPVGAASTQKEAGQPGQVGPTAAAEGEVAKPKPTGRKRGTAEVASIAHRAKQAKDVFDTHAAGAALGDASEFTTDKPVKRSTREAMALKIQGILDKAAEQGLLLREDPKVKKGKGLSKEEKHQFDISIPKYVGDADMSPHVIYLRELVGVRDALRGEKFGPKSTERARVNDFLAEHNVGERGLSLLAERRKIEGARAKAKAGKVTEQTQAGVGSKTHKITDTLGAVPGSERVLKGEEKAEAIRKFNEEQAKRDASAKAAKEEIERPVGAEPSAPAAAATPPVSTPSSINRTEPVKPESKGKAKAKEIKDKGKVEASPELLQAADQHLENLNNLRNNVKNPVQKARLDQAIKTFNEQTSAALKDGDWSAVQKTMADLGVKVPKAKKPKVTPEVTPAKEPTQTVHEEPEVKPDLLSKMTEALEKEHAAEVRSIKEGTAMPSVVKRHKDMAAMDKLVAETQQGEKVDEKTEEKTPPSAPAEVATPPAHEAAKPAQKIDMQMREELKGRGWTELDIRKMSYERAEYILDEGINKGTEEVTPEVTEEGVPEGLTAKQAAEFKKLTPEQRKTVIAALETRSSGKRESKLRSEDMSELDSLSDTELIQRMEEELTAPGIATPAQVRDMDVEEMLRGLSKPKGVHLAADEHDIWETSTHKAADIFGHYDDALSEPMNTSDILRDLDLSHLGKFPKYIQDFVRKRLVEVLDRVPIYLASNNLIADATGTAKNKTPGGYFTRDNKKGTPGHIIINKGAMKYPGEFQRIVIHEALHAALAHRIDADANFRTKIKILKTVLERDTQNHPGMLHIEYALTDEHEFVSEVLSNPQLQNIMSNMALEPEVAEALGIKQKKINTLWGAFVEKVRKTLKIPEGTYNLLHETLKVVAPEIGAEYGKAVRGGYAQDFRKQASPLRTGMDKLKDAAVGALPNADTKVNVTGKLAGWGMAVRTFHQLAQSYQSLFGPSNITNRLFEARAFMERAKGYILDKYGGLKAANTIAKMERKFPELMQRIKDIAFRASLHDVSLDGSNDHLGKDKLMGVQAKNEIAQLQREWNDPSLNPVRGAVQQAMKFFKDIHNAVSRETIKNVLAEANIHDEALVDRIFNDGLTEADEAAWAGTKLVSALNQVRALKQRHGSFIPFRRYGDYISAAEHELSVPSNATKINDNTLQFMDPTGKDSDKRARVAVRAYLRSNSHTPQGNQLVPAQIRSVWVDKNDPSKIIEGEHTDAVPAYRVSMQTEHMEMHETEAGAQNSQKDLEDAGLLNARTHKREDVYKTDVTNIQGAMGTILRSLEKQQRYIDADPKQKLAMREMFHDLTLGLSGTTSVKNSMRQRRNVAGMSHDLGRVTGEYARMTANHLAMLQHRPKMDAILKEMRDYKDDPQRRDKDQIRRDEVYQEFVNRIYGTASKRAEGVPHAAVSRLLQMTRLSFLAGPSFHIINAHEPWTTSLPVLGGEHGMIASMRALKDVYSAIGGRAALVSGFKDIAKAYTNDEGFTDYVKLFKETIGKSKIASADKISRQQDMIEYMDKRNLYSNSSIFEMSKYANPEGNIAGKALDRADLMANQVGTAIEAINRTVTGLAAYNLEYKRNGGNHEAAMHYAYTTAHRTMGDYSGWNAAPVFNTTLGRPLLQFKKFPQKTYMLLGNIMGGVLKGDPAAMKQFAGLMVTHGLVAGALGMPTEPFKLALILANTAGLTGFTPEDYEYAVRKLAADLAGKKGGEILSKGLYRGLGVEVSGRMGLDSLLVRTAPKSQKDADIKAFLFDTMAGASASFLMNQAQGLQAAMKGDFATAVEKISPLRTVGDITKAGVGLYGEKKNVAGKTTQEQFGAWEATVRALGFTPQPVAELGAQRGTEARESKRQGAQRTELMQAWAGATGADKVKAQRAVQRFNEGLDKDEQITQKDLSNAAKRRKREEKTIEHGTVVSKRTRAIHERAENVFNP